MKRFLQVILPFLLLPLSAPQGEEIGAFFTQVNTYIYANGPTAGKRFLVRPRRAFAVVNIATDNGQKVWLKIIDPKRLTRVRGEGWTPLTASELLGNGGKLVEVFSTVFGKDSGGGDSPPVSLLVPATDLKLLNEIRPSARFAQIIWQKVSYETEKPLRAWVRAGTGIFRPGKTTDFLDRTYVEMVSSDLPKKKLRRLLAGVIRVGDSTWDVEHALGKPLRVQEENQSSANRTTWQYASLALQFENDVVNQIN